MDISKLQKLIQNMNADNKKGFFISTSFLNKLKSECYYYKPESKNINQSFLGFEIKEDALMPDNMIAFYNNKNQIICVIKIDDDKITYSEIEPKDLMLDLAIKMDDYPPFIARPYYRLT